MIASMADLAAFILAGGKSSRMGRDKAFLEFRGETLLARSLKLARAVSEHVRIVGNAEKFSAFAPVIEDIYRDCGPLGGIHAALSSIIAELNFMLAVDLPFLDSNLLEYLTVEAKKSDALVTVPKAGAGFQPLCAIYRRDFGTLADEALRHHHNQIDLLFAKINPRIIDERELTRAGFSPEMFRNLNTPEDLEEATARINRREL
jgi:molybdopterin-guanine dinucleotide biosynthesis protein A